MGVIVKVDGMVTLNPVVMMLLPDVPLVDASLTVCVRPKVGLLGPA
jgi:hypothetical protein